MKQVPIHQAVSDTDGFEPSVAVDLVTSNLPGAVVVAFALLAVFEHVWSEDGIVNLTSEDDDSGARLPRTWTLGALSFVLWTPLYLLGFGWHVLAVVSILSASSLMADMTNSRDRWELGTGAAAVLSMAGGTALTKIVFPTDILGSPVILAPLAVLFVMMAVTLVLLYVYQRAAVERRG